ncbi:MAG TPA: hypothetical protein VEK79_14695 [Thermoanaerobaculia bacterium]|nr:hypothetical protein [Thermoanaerobaculia bacterium]
MAKVCGLALVALGVYASTIMAAPSRVLFPKNLHLTRQVEDPLTKKTITIEEYCSGNRVVSVSGEKTVIADYDKQEITEIDRRAGTYSISRFDEVATVATSPEPTTEKTIGTESARAPKRDRWKVTPLGVKAAASRSLDSFEFVEEGQAGRKVEVGIDRSVALSHDAVEVLVGAAYPNPRREEHEPLLRAASVREPSRAIAANAADDTNSDTAYGLPVSQAFTYTDSGMEITFRTTITRVGSELVPAEVLIIPPAAQRVESPATAVLRQLRDLDDPANTRRP